MIRAALLHTPLDPAEELAALGGASPDAGAIVSFVGHVRGEDGTVRELVLEHHPQLTEASLREIAEQAAERFAVDAVAVAHRAGRMAPGEAIVFAGAAARHRRAAFEAADFLMDMLKTEAVFWKRESGPAGERWIEPRAEDRADAARWSFPAAPENGA